MKFSLKRFFFFLDSCAFQGVVLSKKQKADVVLLKCLPGPSSSCEI